MTVIVCLDQNRGMMFHNRRQSRDSAVTEKIQEICAGKRLLMDAYTYRLYGNLKGVETIGDDAFLEKAKDKDYCLAESARLLPVSDRIQGMIVFWWNRIYPSDVFLDLDLKTWEKIKRMEFPGTSHEKITLEYYKRNGDML